jgi:hypothetical protein
VEVERQEDWRSITGAPGGVICIGTGGGGGRLGLRLLHQMKWRVGWHGKAHQLTRPVWAIG